MKILVDSNIGKVKRTEVIVRRVLSSGTAGWERHVVSKFIRPGQCSSERQYRRQLLY